jgi:4-hydroxybenzoyl-CoA reductase subunit beta
MTQPLPAFELVRPSDIAGAVAALREHADARCLGGGTDLLVNIRHGLERPEHLVDLTGIDELTGIAASDAGLRIGAGTTIATLAEAPIVTEHYRALADAALAIAGPGHRVMGTVGGNLCLDTRCIYYNQSEWWRHANGYCLKRKGEVCHVAPQGKRCHAAYCGELAPAMLALGAEVEIAGHNGRRRMPLADLYANDGRAHLTLAAGELIVAAHLPPAPPPSRYAKARLRGAIDFPVAGAAVALAMEQGAVRSLKVALTGTSSRPLLLEGTDAMAGHALDDAALLKLDKLVQRQVEPMRTTTTSAHYRRLAAAGLVRRLATELRSYPDAAS